MMSPGHRVARNSRRRWDAAPFVIPRQSCNRNALPLPAAVAAAGVRVGRPTMTEPEPRPTGAAGRRSGQHLPPCRRLPVLGTRMPPSPCRGPPARQRHGTAPFRTRTPTFPSSAPLRMCRESSSAPTTCFRCRHEAAGERVSTSAFSNSDGTMRAGTRPRRMRQAGREPASCRCRRAPPRSASGLDIPFAPHPSLRAAGAAARPQPPRQSVYVAA